MGFNALAAAGKAEPFTGLGLDIDLCGAHAQITRHMRDHRRDIRCQLGRLSDHSGIHIAHRPACIAHPLACLTQQHAAVCTAVDRIGVWKMATDITQPGGAQQRIDDRVDQHIRVGVTKQSAIMVDRGAANHQRPSGHQRMHIPALPDPPCRLCLRPGGLMRLSRLHAAQVVHGGHLEVAATAGYESRRLASRLDGAGFIGHVRMLSKRLMQHPVSKNLRRLGLPEVFTGHSRQHARGPFAHRRAFDRIGHRQGEQCSDRLVDECLVQTLDAVAINTRARRIMHPDPVGFTRPVGLGGHLQTGEHAVAPAGATDGGHLHPRIVHQSGQRLSYGIARRNHHDHPLTGRGVEQARDGALQDGRGAQWQVLLGAVCAHARSGPSSRHHSEMARGGRSACDTAMRIWSRHGEGHPVVKARIIGLQALRLRGPHA